MCFPEGLEDTPFIHKSAYLFSPEFYGFRIKIMGFSFHRVIASREATDGFVPLTCFTTYLQFVFPYSY
jgi:hypothetical protein